MYILEGEIRIDIGGGDSTVASAGAAVALRHGVPHVWQVLSGEARFLTVNAGRRNAPSFDRFVAAGTPTDPRALPDPIEIDPGHVAHVCAQHGIEVLGPAAPTARRTRTPNHSPCRRHRRVRQRRRSRHPARIEQQRDQLEQSYPRSDRCTVIIDT